MEKAVSLLVDEDLHHQTTVGELKKGNGPRHAPALRLSSTLMESGGKTLETKTPKMASVANVAKNVSAISNTMLKRISKAQEDAPAGIPSASSDKHSEDGSTSQDDQKKRVKNPQQQKTKPIKKKKTTFDASRPELISHFAKICPEKKLRKADQLKQFLAQRYQMKIAEIMTEQLTPRFGGFVNSFPIEEYYAELSKFVNEDDELKRFEFKIFDVYKEDKITEEGLFTFMKFASMRKLDEDAAPTKILSLHEKEDDIFLDYFQPQYTKILKALVQKKADRKKTHGKMY